MVIWQAERELERILETSGVIDFPFDAKQILMKVLDIDEARLLLIRTIEMPEDKRAIAIDLAKKRAEGIPLQYLMEQWEFYGLPFKVGPGVLIPRPETEMLVEIAVKHLSPGDKLLDLCSGTGCIPIAAAKLTGCTAYGVELFDEALEYFRENIRLNDVGERVKAVQGDFFNPKEFSKPPFPGKFSLITVNPPYLSDRDMNNLQQELLLEPKTALYGGKDGLDYYKELFQLYPKYLEKDGMIAAEIGDDQGEVVSQLAQGVGLKVRCLKDHSGKDRAIIAFI